MIKRSFVALLLLCSFVLLNVFYAPSAFAYSTAAHACRSTPLPASTGVGYGSTSAQVSVTLWKDCFRNYYASANSVKQSDGNAFTGTLYFTYYNSQNSPSVAKATCGAGVCDTDHIPLDDDSYTMSWAYVTNNGWQFHSVSGAAQLDSSLCDKCEIDSDQFSQW